MGFDLWNLGITDYFYWLIKNEKSPEEGEVQSPGEVQGLGRAAKVFAFLIMVLLIFLFALVEKEVGKPVSQKPSMKAPDPATRPLGKGEKIKLRYYVVKRGDTFPRIARECYGSTKEWRRIFHANQHKVSSPARLRVGQRLYIPPLNPLDYLGR